MEHSNDPWRDVVEIEDTKTADFEGRDRSVNIWDPHSVYRNVGEKLSENCGLHRSECFDFCLRAYLGWYSDTHEDLREHVDQTRLIPPKGWIQQHKDELPSKDAKIERQRIDHTPNKQINFQTTETVYEMVKVLMDVDDDISKADTVAKTAITFVVDGYEPSEKRLDERPTSM